MWIEATGSTVTAMLVGAVLAVLFIVVTGGARK